VYLFDLVNVILVASVSPKVVLDPTVGTWGKETIWEILGQTLPGMSLFYINFIMVIAFTGFIFELIQVFRYDRAVLSSENLAR
jgi:hypothetical protein